MNLGAYPFNANSDKLVFQFESVSDEKTILKEVSYSCITETEPFIYNLFLGDFDPINESLSDISITNNQDMEKVLATVAQTMIDFFSNRPECYILFMGNNSARTRLYRIAIANYKHEFEDIFKILGRVQGKFELFEPNRPYDAFLITLKE